MEHDEPVEVEITRGRADAAPTLRRLAIIAANAAVIGIVAWALVGQRSPDLASLVASPFESTTVVVLSTTSLPVADTTPASDAATTVVVEESAVPTTTASDNDTFEPDTPQPTTPPPSQPPEATTTIAYAPQDIYGDICVPLNWVNCAEYIIYDVNGDERNRVIANSDWTNEYIGESSGGGPGGYAVKVRDIYPCDTCVSYR